jgi:hypothetical protein
MVALAVGSRPRTSHAASHLRHPHGRAALDAAADVFFAFLVVMTPCYLAVVEIAKRRFYRDAGI